MRRTAVTIVCIVASLAVGVAFIARRAVHEMMPVPPPIIFEETYEPIPLIPPPLPPKPIMQGPAIIKKKAPAPIKQPKPAVTEPHKVVSKPAYDCETVRYYHERFSEQFLLAMAAGAGVTDAQIEQAKKCLK